jgi:ATP-dependent DNA helicase RecG
MKLGYVDILVGTHTLFQEKFDMPKQVGLIVIDEQHSFGIEQRMELVNKCAQADILMMSATPMQYTKTMVESDKIAISHIRTRPNGKKHEPIMREIDLDEKYDVLIGWLKKKINQGERVFWVCPLIDKSERLKYMDVNTRYQKLCGEFGEDKILLIHGKMKQEKKDQILLQFRDDFSKKILVATQVIEMGIDVPSVNIMVIENAEKFGDVQMKQLKGRVGR